MIFDFSSNNEVQINMNLYISKIIKEFPEEIIGKHLPLQGITFSRSGKMDANLMMRCNRPVGHPQDSTRPSLERAASRLQLKLLVE
jgi:hypothetical protein